MSKNENPLKILFATAEVSPLMSTGGLAEVANALPKALAAFGHDVRIVMPCYRGIAEKYRGKHRCICEARIGGKTVYGGLRESQLPGSSVPLFLIEHEGYFGRANLYGSGAYEYSDNAERFSFFCFAALNGIAQTDWVPDIIHCHDWHTAAIPAYLKTLLKEDPVWGGVPTVFTIHNLAYQGQYSVAHLEGTGFGPEYFTPDFLEFYGDINLMKAGILSATRVSTVSPRYAREIKTPDYGVSLDPALRQRGNNVHGILNGVDYDQWDPMKDPYIAARYGADNMAGKHQCKQALQKMLGLPLVDAPVFGVVSRLFWQKGIDLVIDAIEELVPQNLQMVVQGTGDPELEEKLAKCAERFPGKVAAVFRYDVALAHQIQAGADFFLMPSRYEPCGLSQLYSMAYGTVPIVRRTGGLADSVIPLNPVTRKKGSATGISFVPLTPQAVLRSISVAMDLYKDKAAMARVRANGMKERFSWERSCEAYLTLYRESLRAA